MIKVEFASAGEYLVHHSTAERFIDQLFGRIPSPDVNFELELDKELSDKFQDKGLVYSVKRNGSITGSIMFKFTELENGEKLIEDGVIAHLDENGNITKKISLEPMLMENFAEVLFGKEFIQAELAKDKK